ncbi:MAG: chemotaxis regulator - transmits chemoreceptor signals to flagelllar motor component cheY [Flavipsychrobacter sp.]|jgi:signal transduction histidine kinase|nr:chemotaxis regulator - transmits chemoreceptor signals to flagelllar motor component cheY [Flavipsychrobacter sp.]
MADMGLQPFTILLVDDREENLIALEEMLQEEGRIFLKATSGNDALRLALKNDSIGLVLLDVQMPQMDGFEVAQLLKSNPKTKDVSIIFVTAISKEEQYVMQGFGEGALDYLHKPLDFNVTRAKVKVFEQLYFYQLNLKSALNEVSKINKQLEQFVYVVAHDLKSPLAGIIGMLSIMNEEKEIVESPQLQEYVGMMSLAAGHLSEMITSILVHSKQTMDQQAVEDVDVDEMVRQLAKLLFPPAHITISIKDKLPKVRARRMKLQQVFQNLISNAIKYNDKAAGLIEIGCTGKEGCTEFYVKDNGPGISNEDQEKIFRLFQTTSNKTQADSSTGVGLNIIKMNVEEQGGRIWVESISREGSCFYFTWNHL